MLSALAARVLAMSRPRPSWNLIDDIRQLLHYPFMRHAFVAGTVTAALAGVMSYFVVLRQSTFASHALAEIGFAGASGGVAYGFGAIPGLLVLALGGAALIGTLGKRVRSRDTAIGMVLAFSLGLGSYFITRYKSESASGPFGLLFGEILGISVHDVWFITISAVVTLAVLAAIYRPLLFASLDEDLAEARGVPVRALSVVFFVLLAVAVTAAVQVVGVLLIFALLVAPGAISDRVCKTAGRGVALCVVVAVVLVWTGLTITYYSSFPVGFLISALAFGAYLVARLLPAIAGRLIRATSRRQSTPGSSSGGVIAQDPNGRRPVRTEGDES